MSISIKRGGNAPEAEGLTAGETYPVLGYTDANAIILDDNSCLISVGFKQINVGEDWALSEKKEKSSKSKN